MPAAAVELDGEALLSIQQVGVDLAAVEEQSGVDLRAVDAGAVEEVESVVLEVAPGRHMTAGDDCAQRGRARVAKRAAHDVVELVDGHAALCERLADHAPQRIGRHVGGEIQRGARGRGHADVVAPPNVALVQRARPARPDPVQSATGAAAHDHLHVAVVPARDPPPGSRRPVAERGVVAAREDRRCHLTAHRQHPGADGVDAAIAAMQLPPPHAHGDRRAVQPAGRELTRRDHRVLLTGEPDRRQIGPRCDVRWLRL